MKITNNIALIGMMGSGKTTIGKLLAEALNLKFLDMDAQIEKTQGMKIVDIFENFGEKHFRNLENELLENALKQSGQVISTGGGIVENAQNIQKMLQNAHVFYLKASPAVLLARTSKNKNRPLLNVKNAQLELEKILKRRENSYQAAHFEICAEKESGEIIEEIKCKLRQ